MATYISMTINERINYKATQANKARAYGTGMKNCIWIYNAAHECTGEKPATCIRTFSRVSRRHFQ